MTNNSVEDGKRDRYQLFPITLTALQQESMVYEDE